MNSAAAPNQAAPAVDELFVVDDVSLSFGGLTAVDHFSLALPAGSLQGLIGPNGAGKTTVFNLITGVYKPDAGEIRLAGKRIHGLPPWKIAAAGVARTFQNIRLFGELTVIDNVRIGAHVRCHHTLLQAMLRSPAHVRGERQITQTARRLLHKLGLDDRRNDFARNLPYGDQRRLEIARALATAPKLLLLDEPAAGTNPNEKAALTELIRQVREEFDLTLLLIEHDMGLVMQLCERITVLDHGQVIARGTPREIQNNPQVIEAYLGHPPK